MKCISCLDDFFRHEGERSYWWDNIREAVTIYNGNALCRYHAKEATQR